ncbi:hypothetical protein TNCT_335481 [Trichonephila clavata]|uniref:Uncharacterized protein n=1 Tax=Trichonephila clavata TaxID=2740835 RepID=A0A8X6L834_TRICU|nr:hypothetical protein TNCT_335481 [Trichonephila clavata]
MAYLGKCRREDIFILAMELNLRFDKSMTIATLKDLITGSEGYDEELTENLHATIVEDRKSNEERIHIEERALKLRIEEREEKLRIEELRIDEQKRKDEFELEKLRFQAQSNLGAATSEGTNYISKCCCISSEKKRRSEKIYPSKCSFYKLIGHKIITI